MILRSLLLCVLASGEPAAPTAAGPQGLLQAADIVLVGEQHGTVEIPEFFLDLVGASAESGRPLLVGLELPESERERVEAFLNSSGDDASRKQLIAGRRWQAEYQYGQTSEAVYRLLDGLRSLRGAGHEFRVVLFDQSARDGAQARDRRMADHLARVIKESPGSLLLVLTGNIHSRVVQGTMWNPAFEPMGYLLGPRVPAKRIVALDVAHHGGTAWACLGPEVSDCGVQKFGAHGPQQGGGITLDGSPEDSGHHGSYHVGAIHASPPARDGQVAGASSAPTPVRSPGPGGKAGGLSDYWRSHEKTPLDYLAEKFRDKRWIIVGEYHRIRHDVQLIVSLVPRLHETTDVRHLAMEFLCRDHTAEANRLVSADTYDRKRMIDFFREQFPGWSYEEYLEIFHSVWASNRKLAAERGMFRLVGLHPCIDWETINYGTDPEAVAAERRKLERYDEIMAETLEKNVLRPGHKALVFTGIAHATGKFTEYRSGTAEQLLRMGNLVNREPYRRDMFFVALHAPFYDHAAGREIYPFDGVLDELMPAFGKDIGFDVVGTPFEGLVHRSRSERTITAYSFGELYDGYVMFRTPIKEYVGVTCIDDWVTDEQELREFTRGVINKSAAEAFAKMSLQEFRAGHCAPRPDHGTEFRRRFRDLPDLLGSSGGS